MLVEALQKLSLWAWSGKLSSGGLNRGAEDLDRLLVGEGATIQSGEKKGFLGAHAASLRRSPDDVLLEGVVRA